MRELRKVWLALLCVICGCMSQQDECYDRKARKQFNGACDDVPTFYLFMEGMPPGSTVRGVAALAANYQVVQCLADIQWDQKCKAKSETTPTVAEFW